MIKRRISKSLCHKILN